MANGSGPRSTTESYDGVPLHCFSVEIEGVNFKTGLFTGCEGLSIEYAFEEYQEGGNNAYVHRLPGRVKFQNIKLTRLISAESGTLASWFSEYQKQGSRPQRRTATITMYHYTGGGGGSLKAICKWILKDVHPAKWTGPSFAADGSGVAKETIELAHHGFTWETA